jgi:hypothetical protein
MNCPLSDCTEPGTSPELTCVHFVLLTLLLQHGVAAVPTTGFGAVAQSLERLGEMVFPGYGVDIKTCLEKPGLGIMLMATTVGFVVTVLRR